MGVTLAVAGASGIYLIYSVVSGRRQPEPHGAEAWTVNLSRLRAELHARAARRGLGDVSVRGLTATMTFTFLVAASIGVGLLGGLLPGVALGAFASTFPVAVLRSRRDSRRAEAREAWPRLIEEIRLNAGSLGRSIPQALFEVGRRAPTEMTQAFAAAEREWLISADFARTVGVLKSTLEDPTADAICETLLVAHEVGGTDVERRLAALVEDRVQELQGRKDARAKQAGVRFARRFVLIVPAGMALAGLSIGTGRASYASPLGQAAVVTGIAAVILCWAWAGRLLRLPEEERVFHD